MIAQRLPIEEIKQGHPNNKAGPRELVLISSQVKGSLSLSYEKEGNANSRTKDRGVWALWGDANFVPVDSATTLYTFFFHLFPLNFYTYC